jgi:hypothetical protein
VHEATALRNRLSQSTLEQLLHIALNGPATLDEFRNSGLLKEALTYFFTLKDRNAKPPAAYIDRELMRKLDRLKWTTSCRFEKFEASEGSQPLTEKSAATFAALEKELKLGWPHDEDAELEDAGEFVDGDVLMGQDQDGVATEPSTAADEPTSIAEAWADAAPKATKPRKKRRGANDLNDSLSHNYTDPSQIAPTGPSELRATRSRAGRASTPRVFLSYNHHDRRSATMLTNFT